MTANLALAAIGAVATSLLAVATGFLVRDQHVSAQPRFREAARTAIPRQRQGEK